MTDESMKHLGGISVELESLSVFCQVGIAMLEMFLEKEKVRKINTEIDLKESVKKRNTCKLASKLLSSQDVFALLYEEGDR